ECYRPPFTGNSNGKPYTVNGPWQSHPKRMLRHKAMIQCARLAFSFTGIYDEDEAKNILNAEKATIPQNQEPAIDVSASIKALEIAAESGKETFATAWQSLDESEKNAIGMAEFKRIKSMIVIDAEYSEVPNGQ
ncbi:MAG: recombinase RecT, partial [Wohlfahrtiimonas sp.]